MESSSQNHRAGQQHSKSESEMGRKLFPRQLQKSSTTGRSQICSSLRAYVTLLACLVGVLSQQKADAQISPAAQALEKQLTEFQIPPAWIHDVTPKWNVRRPWKEGRQEIRRLLALKNESSRREGIRLTWDYLQKKTSATATSTL